MPALPPPGAGAKPPSASDGIINGFFQSRKNLFFQGRIPFWYIRVLLAFPCRFCREVLPLKRFIPRRGSESVVKRTSRGDDGVDNDPAGPLLFSMLGKVIPDPVIGEVEVSPDHRHASLYLLSDIPHQIELNECSEDFVVRYNDHVHSRRTG